jgi:hypothetical protein
MPAGTKSLLSLGLKFCPTRPCPTNNIKKTIDLFKKEARRITFFRDKPSDDHGGIPYIPTLNIKTDKRKPPTARKAI